MKTDAHYNIGISICHTRSADIIVRVCADSYEEAVSLALDAAEGGCRSATSAGDLKMDAPDYNWKEEEFDVDGLSPSSYDGECPIRSPNIDLTNLTETFNRAMAQHDFGA